MRQTLISNNVFSRRKLLRAGLGGTAVGLAGTVVAPASLVAALDEGGRTEVDGPTSPVGDIYRLQAAFHRAKTMQDIDLMMSLWAEDATFNSQGDPNSPYIDSESLKAFWLNSGSFKNRRLSLVPSFKTQIAVRSDDEAWLYFECHDVGDYDQPARAIAGDTFLAGTVRNLQGKWVFWDMTAGSSSPLSADHYYFSA
jgi:hypothetical protein